jgi:hypothetical protein
MPGVAALANPAGARGRREALDLGAESGNPGVLEVQGEAPMLRSVFRSVHGGSLILAGALLAGMVLAPRAGRTEPPPNVSLDAPALVIKKPKPGAPEVKAQPVVWPRLDAGAVLCRSESDLRHLAQRRSGDPNAGPVDCRVMTATTGIDILQRKGPGLTEVRVTGGARETGWTDVWLPARPPAGAQPGR